MHMEVDESRNDETPGGRDPGRARRGFHAPTDRDNFPFVDDQIAASGGKISARYLGKSFFDVTV